jgi:glycerol uptake facilitator-like aquaporin
MFSSLARAQVTSYTAFNFASSLKKMLAQQAAAQTTRDNTKHLHACVPAVAPMLAAALEK